MIDTLFDLGGLAADVASDLAVDAASNLAVDAASDLTVDVASNLSGILENGLAEGLAEVAGLHLTNLPRAWDLVAETLHKNLVGDDKGSADA